MTKLVPIKGIGLYHTMPSEIGNNNLSSILLPPGWKVYIWGDEGFRGATNTFANTGTQYDQLIALDNSSGNVKWFIVSWFQYVVDEKAIFKIINFLDRNEWLLRKIFLDEVCFMT